MAGSFAEKEIVRRIIRHPNYSRSPAPEIRQAGLV